MTLTQALVGEAVPPRQRAKYQGYLATVALTSNAFGPVVGGLLTELFGWRSVFLVNTPLWLLAIMLVLRLPDRRGSGEKFSFDFAGLVLYASFTIAVLLGLQYVQKLDVASLGTALALLLAAIAFMVLLVLRERSAGAPLFPPTVVSNPSIWRSDGLAACHGAILVSLITFSPIYFHVVHGVSIAQTGLLLLPMTIALATGSLATGRIVSWSGYTAIFPSWGMLVVALLLASLALGAPMLNAFQTSLMLGLTALFMGSVMGVVQVTVQVSAGPSMLGTAAATVQLSRSLGASFGTAAVGAVLFVTMRMMDPQAAEVMTSILQRSGDVPALAQATGLQARSVIGDAFRFGFATMAIFAAISSLLAWSIPLRKI
jgi:predicted MFS family arabinose efflux permease